MRGTVSRELCMIMMLLNVSERVRGGSKRFNTCMSDGLTPELCTLCLPFRPSFSLFHEKVNFYAVIGYVSLVVDDASQTKKEAPKKENFQIPDFYLPARTGRQTLNVK